jgi:carboxymethylenebutenolidase
MNAHIATTGQHGVFAAYIARPKTLPAAAVVVLQELFGVNADIRKHCHDLAEQGFIAVAPDLFWRQQPGVDLSVTSEADWQSLFCRDFAYSTVSNWPLDAESGARSLADFSLL